MNIDEASRYQGMLLQQNYRVPDKPKDAATLVQNRRAELRERIETARKQLAIDEAEMAQCDAMLAALKGGAK